MNIPDDFYTHEDTWRKALEHLIALEPNQDNRAFWLDELKAFNRAYEELHKGCLHNGARYYDTSGRKRCAMCGGDL